MRKPRNATGTATHAKLHDAAAAVRGEAEAAETDPFDDAVVAAVAGLTEALKAESADVEAVRGRMVRLARQISR